MRTVKYFRHYVIIPDNHHYIVQDERGIVRSGKETPKVLRSQTGEVQIYWGDKTDVAAVGINLLPRGIHWLDSLQRYNR